MTARYLAAICVAILSAIALAPSAFAQQKTAKACSAEWRANKAANQAAGKTEKAYVAECRGGAAEAPAATPATAPATAPTPTPAPKVATRPIPAKPAPTNAPTGAGEFSTEGEAKAHCPVDLVVWANTKSKIYHFNGTKDYGNTKAGAYMCEKDTVTAGIRAAKNEKHP